MTHLIFDVRDNTGGYMDQALLLSNDFLSPGDTIVYIEGLHRAREVYKADGRGMFQSMGLTVLISENSASASEIFAGAIQDNDRGHRPTLLWQGTGAGAVLLQRQFRRTAHGGAVLYAQRSLHPKALYQ